jgi:diguanylate cyclase (GGDEF)-like protein
LPKPDPSHKPALPRAQAVRLARLRMRLALATVAVLPIATAGVFVHYSAQPDPPIALAAAFAGLGLALVWLVVRMLNEVARPLEEMIGAPSERPGPPARPTLDESLRDGLTGLGNHRAFQEELDRQVEQQRQHKDALALVLIDIDDLGLLNAGQGHHAGDRAIAEMGRLIREMKRNFDHAFRVGGDEFAILMPFTSAEGALKFGRRLLYRAANQPGTPVRFSGGISACPELAATREQLTVQAEAALAWCKRHGRAALDVYVPQRDRAAADEQPGSHPAQIAHAISGGLLGAAYQPIVELRSGLVVGYEGLVRPQPESGFANPGALFAAADAAGRTVELDRACVEAVVANAGQLADDQLLTVNLSPATVEGPLFSVEWLTGIFARHGFDARRVVIELTEHQSIEDLPRLQRNLFALQQAGVRIAVDDVGAGNAGLRLLSQLRFDIVKIDLSLVQDGTRRDSSRAVLSSLRELAGRWNAYVIAEGIETPGQLRVVRELGLAAGQGYLLGRPAPMTTLRSVDLAFIEAGGSVMEVRPRPAAEMLASMNELSRAPQAGSR